MKNLIKTLLVALVVIFMISVTFLSASAAPTFPVKNHNSVVKYSEIQNVIVINFHNSINSVEKANSQDVKIDFTQKKDDFTMTMPWALPNPTGWTNPNARANSFC